MTYLQIVLSTEGNNYVLMRILMTLLYLFSVYLIFDRLFTRTV